MLGREATRAASDAVDAVDVTVAAFPDADCVANACERIACTDEFGPGADPDAGVTCAADVSVELGSDPETVIVEEVGVELDPALDVGTGQPSGLAKSKLTSVPAP
jgi:hypothetical protein